MSKIILFWQVECQWPNKPFFEPIAAFNSQQVAIEYARDCKRVNPHFTYRLFNRNSRKVVEYRPC